MHANLPGLHHSTCSLQCQSCAKLTLYTHSSEQHWHGQQGLSG